MWISGAYRDSRISRFRYSAVFRVALVCALALDLTPANAAPVEKSAATESAAPGIALTDPAMPASEIPQSDWSAEMESQKSYLIPALDIVGFDFLLNRFDRAFIDHDDFDVSMSSIKRNLRSDWNVDRDTFKVNQLGHPYQGSMYHGFARSAGLNYWESLAYTFAGSLFWEIAGETTPPSKNDQIMTGIGGSFLGESLFRMSSLVLEKGGSTPSLWREIGAAVISPATGFNRLAFGERFDSVFSSRDPAYYGRAQFGASTAIQRDRGTSTELEQNQALADFAMDYGLPGQPGYTYTRPFDYFAFEATASSANVLENVMTRGLLIGKDYEAGESYRGVWGLYGSYDYISPQTFRVSSTALSLGTTGQAWLTDTVALQGTALAGLGYAAVGTIDGAHERDYHYGVAPQALLALRLIWGDKASLDVTGREYFVSDVGADRGGHDNIVRADVAFTWRLQKNHAVTVKYLWNHRDASYPDLGDRSQTVGTLGIFYTILGNDRFGTVDWR